MPTTDRVNDLGVYADIDDTILTIKEVAAYLKVNERTLYRLAARGDIPAFKVGGSWRFRKDTLEQWIEQQSNQRTGG